MKSKSNNIESKGEKGRETIESEVFINTVRLSDKTLVEANKLLSIWGMTFLQYSTLRILHDNDLEDKGLSSKDIGKKLYTRVPDVTRLLDRLADKDWITRERDIDNRRIVRSRLTKIGKELVTSVYLPVKELEKKQLSSLTDREKQTLVKLLHKALSNNQ